MPNKKTSNRSKPAQPKWFLWLSLVVVIAAAIGGYSIWRSQQVEQAFIPTATSQTLPSDITVDEAFLLYQEGALIVDVRPQVDWMGYHILNSISIPLAELAARSGEVPVDQNIVVVCFSPEECYQGRAILLEAGLTTVTAMRESIEGWVLKGYPFEGNFAY